MEITQNRTFVLKSNCKIDMKSEIYGNLRDKYITTLYLVIDYN